MFSFRDDKGLLKCSFCGKTQESVRKLIAGPGVYICDECIHLCNEIIEEELAAQKPELSVKTKALAKPKEIKEILDQYVIGQEWAKKVLSVAVYNHYKRVFMKKDNGKEEIELQKSNVLFIGPSGCGKTYLAQTLARILNVPFALADATTLTEAGYVGEDVENILLKLIQNADHDVKKAERGIIYVDEIDKITRKQDNPSITRDVSGEGVQQGLLKILEGTIANVPPQGGRKHPQQELIQIDTSNILFICGGAFETLDKMVEARLKDQHLGFRANIQSKTERNIGEILAQVMPEDLLKFGLIPEFVGRLPIVATFEALDEEALRKILVEPRNALVKQYQKIFEMDGVGLTFTEQAVAEIASQAFKRKTGARALRSIIEEVMLDIMYEIPSLNRVKSCVITEEVIKKLQQPELTFEKEKKAS